MTLNDDLEALVKRHGATSYRNRADTQHPAYGFTPAGLLNLLAEVTAEVCKQDDALIRQMLSALTDLVEAGEEAWGADRPCVRIGKEEITAARARLPKEP